MRKDERIEETIRKILRILYTLNIPIKIVNVSNVFEYIYSVQVEFGDNLGIKTNGKGCSFEQALASALAEGMERIQTRNSFKFWYSSKCVPQKYLYPEYITEVKLERELEKYFEKYKTYKIYKFRLDFYELKTEKVVSLPDRLINLLCGSNGLCAGTARITIDFDGEVLLCPSLPQYSIGNILKDDFYKIWNSPLRKAYIKKIKELNQDKKVCFIYDEFS